MFADWGIMWEKSTIAFPKVWNADMVFPYTMEIWFKYFNLHVLMDQQKSN